MRTLVLLVSCLALGVRSRGQELSERQRSEMLDCVFHREGRWVDTKLYADGNIRFTYVYEPSNHREPAALHVAFWNRTETEGKLLEFQVFLREDHGDHFAIVNDGWIKENSGRLDVEDALGGIYTYEQMKRRLPTLKRGRVVVVPIRQLRTTSAVCSSPLSR